PSQTKARGKVLPVGKVQCSAVSPGEAQAATLGRAGEEALAIHEGKNAGVKGIGAVGVIQRIRGGDDSDSVRGAGEGGSKKNHAAEVVALIDIRPPVLPAKAQVQDEIGAKLDVILAVKVQKT